MRWLLYLVVIFSSSVLFANDSIENVFKEWLKYYFSGGSIGAPSRVFDTAIKLVAEKKGIEAREQLKMVFPLDDIYIDAVVQLFEDANNAMSK